MARERGGEDTLGSGNGDSGLREDQLWDDDAFRRRCADLAEEKGISLRETVLRAKTSADYLTKQQLGRNTNVVMRLARFFEVTPAFLAWGEGSVEPAVDLDRRLDVNQEQIAVIGKISMLLMALDPRDYASETCLKAIEAILRRA